MEQSTTTTEAPDPQVTTSELNRPTEGRMLAGVAMGLANRFNLPVLLVRIAFILFTFGGGLGVAMYAAGWFLIRAEDETEAPAERFFSNATGSKSWIGIGLVFLAVLLLLDNFTFLSGGTVWAVGLLVVGVLLYTGDLPRLIRGHDNRDNKAGVQQMTTKTEMVPPSGGAPAGGTPPPTPTPTPPILPPTPPKKREKSILGRVTLGVMALSMGMLAAMDNIEGVPVYPEPRHYLALAVTILGLGLMVGGFAGRARWLILVGVILVPSLLFSPVFEWDWSSDGFDRNITVTSFEDLEGSYRIDVGNLEIDLTELPWAGETIQIDARVDAGNIEVFIPDGVGASGVASVDVGRVAVPGREASGLGDPTIEFDWDGSLGHIDLDLAADVGNVEVIVVAG